jgi:hypothetical protein
MQGGAGSGYDVEVLAGGNLLSRFSAPFQAAAMSLAREVARRLTPMPGVDVIVVCCPSRWTVCIVRGTLTGWQIYDMAPPLGGRKRRVPAPN